mgnify:CR=1 FL=1
MISEDLKEYLNHRTDGYFEFKSDNLHGMRIKSCVRKYYFPNSCNCYVKEMLQGDESYPMVSAELLLSRLLPKLGIKSVEYLPFVNNKGIISVITKDISGRNISDGIEFFNEVMAKSAGNGNCFLNSEVLVFADEQNRGELNTINNFHKYANSDTFKQLHLLRAFDLATLNNDRNPGNLFIERDEKDIGVGIIGLDYEMSGAPSYYTNNYYSTFSSKRLPGMDVIDAYKENEDYQKYITRFEIAETIASAPFDETAREVKDEMGFVIEPNFLDRMKSNTDIVAEELVK